MPDPITVQGSTILTAEPPAPPKSPEAVLFPTNTPPVTPPVTPDPTVPPVTPPVVPPVTPPPVTPSEPPKPPEEPPKPGAPAAPAAAPTDYALTLPTDSPLTPEELATVQKEAKDAGLTKEKAEQMLQSKDQTARAAQTRLQEQQAKAFEATKTQWRSDVEKDPEMGGDKFNETVALSSRAFKTLASPELQIWAEKTGLGSYPEFVRLMAKVGKLMSEDRLIRGSVNEPPAKKSPEEILFGKTTPKT